MTDRKKEIGRRIARLMAECGISSRKELSDLIKEEASKADPPEKGVTSTTVGRWVSGQDEPKASSLVFLAKALNVSADTILYGENLGPMLKNPRGMSIDVLKEAIEAVILDIKPTSPENQGNGLAELKKSELEKELLRFQRSRKVPQEDKEIIIAQIRRLLKRYEDLTLDESGSEDTQANGRVRNKEQGRTRR